MIDHCPICLDTSLSVTNAPVGGDMLRITCPKCGTYDISGPAMSSDLTVYGAPYLLSGILRNRFENGEISKLTTSSLSHLIESVPKFDDPFSKIDLLLKHVFHLCGRVDRDIQFDPSKDFPLLYAEDLEEFFFYLQKGLEMNLLENPTSAGFRLTTNGWLRLREISKISINTDQAFVAMWFDSSLDSAWFNGLSPALIHCKLKPIRIDLEEHNEKICDRIIAEIRKSGLLIADFTGQRGGVYFESGYAMGLGIPVIRTCRKDFIDSLHFDTRQYNHIIWESPEELKTKLINRIQATLPNIISAS